MSLSSLLVIGLELEQAQWITRFQKIQSVYMSVVPQLLLLQAIVLTAGSTFSPDNTIPIFFASPVGLSCFDCITTPSTSSFYTSCSAQETSSILTLDDCLLISEASRINAATTKASVKLAEHVHPFLPSDILKIEHKDIQEMDPA
ncbi:uncharacterized protein PHACADRAFT_34020 [Phanerochaete carnosa HHB-10118-sp]|uniref:Uncharacterized protein n=1 Tax=Phanerochaete carnosa (strain HHB-10118-sp) TaxID=650164 RepID=K5VAJ5_PHACS|nr:uncharacterized protein PHACADRAFT_34020 [Phanerochaete carnosa HHB-10118-sp]EKM48108.1 hypothetical protein PHACADRAFT_34020 [Phanerochaete carnosa HHB-10118-sp]